MRQHIDPKLLQITHNLSDSISILDGLTSEINHSEMNETVKTLHLQLESPFTFVIVGEVKAGKSSFINALLDANKEICKVAPSPMTDTIQQIVYGEEEGEIYVNEYIKKITEPVEILKEIAIVDTPGTNTIIDHHQEITEKFIPYSDLIVFVFEAKNPYRQSSWEFFDYINSEWRRKIIFILQQKDLLNESDLNININGVKDHALKKGIEKPNVFAVSAKQELEGDKSNSGYIPLRAYIEENITGGRAPYLKLQNTVITSRKICDTIESSLSLREEQFLLDKKFRDDIRQTLDHQEIKTNNQVNLLVENLVAAFDRISTKKESELEKGLSFVTVMKRSFSALFSSNKDGGIKEWLTRQAKDFELQLNTSLKDKLQAGVIDVADNIQMMGKIVDAKIKTNRTVLTDADEIFSDIAERRANVLKDLYQSFSQFMNTSENFYDDALINESSKMAPNLATGGGIAIIGVILTAVVNGAVFDITGGILTTVGVLFAGVSLGLNKRKVINKFKEEIEKGRLQMENEVSEKLTGYTGRIKDRINANFLQFDQHLEKEEKNLQSMRVTLHKIDLSLEDNHKLIEQEIKKIA